MKAILLCLKIILRERPDVVISTGAAIGCIACMIGKLTSAKIVWIDSITNVEKLSLSGRLVRPIANLFLAQWQQLAQQYKNVIFEGTLI
jgi:UDP-N-acetylglucosamine:LPS N-acetylglucosamine transferase